MNNKIDKPVYVRFSTRLALIFCLVFIFCLLISCSYDAGDLFPSPDIEIQNQSNQPVSENINSFEFIDTGPHKGGNLNLFSTFPDTLNPLMTKNPYVKEFLQLVFEGLFSLDTNQKPIPVLCVSYNISGDGLSWTFHLRKGITWHNESMFTANDVKATFDFITDASNNSIYRQNLYNIVTYTAVSPYVFKTVLKYPDSFMAELLTFPVMPSLTLNSRSVKSESVAQQTFNGTGPYKFDASKNENFITLLASENWWGAVENEVSETAKVKAPYIQNLTIKLYPSPENALPAFLAGEIDILQLGGTEFDHFKGRDDVLYKIFPCRIFDFIAFNVMDPVFIESGTRQAIYTLIDKDEIIKKTLQGNVLPSDFPVLPETWLNGGAEGATGAAGANRINGITGNTGNTGGANSSDNNGKKERFEKAEMLLKENGWKKENNLYYKLINNKKTPLEMSILVNIENRRRKLVAEKIKEQLSIAGIPVNIIYESWDKVTDLLDKHKFQVALTGVSIPTAPGISFLYSNSYPAPFQTTSSIHSSNISGYIDNYLEGLFDVMKKEISFESRYKLFEHQTEFVNSSLPYIGLYFEYNAMVSRKNIRGNIDPYIWNRYYDITTWYLVGE